MLSNNVVSFEQPGPVFHLSIVHLYTNVLDYSFDCMVMACPVLMNGDELLS